MTHPDEVVVDQLRRTFAAHEDDVDADVARRLALGAPPGRRRRRPALVAAAAAVVLVAALGVVVGGHRLGASGPSSTPIPVPAPVAAGTNARLAHAAAERLMRRIPVPSGASPRSTAPAPGLRGLEARLEPVDVRLSATRWWVVPMGYRALVHFYVARTPAHLASARRSDGTIGTSGTLDWVAGAGRPNAYSAPYAVLAYTRLSGHTTAIRVDVTLAARWDRTAGTLAPGSVTSLVVTDTTQVDYGARTTRSVTVDDRRVVARAVRLFDALPGEYAGVGDQPCPDMVLPDGGITTHSYAVTFRWPGHELGVGTVSTGCSLGTPLRLDGTTLPRTVEESATFEAALREAAGGR